MMSNGCYYETWMPEGRHGERFLKSAYRKLAMKFHPDKIPATTRRNKIQGNQRSLMTS